MMNPKQISSPLSTGGAGYRFEAYVQSMFVVLMLAGGRAPLFPECSIYKIKLQGRHEGFQTDDVIVFVKEIDGQEKKLVGNIKKSIHFNNKKSNKPLASVIGAAWQDYNNQSLFTKGTDKIALLTSQLNNTDSKTIPWILDQAQQHTASYNEFARKMSTAKINPPNTTEKLELIRHYLATANGGSEIHDHTFYDFLKHFYVLSFDFKQIFHVEHSLLLTIIDLCSTANSQLAFSSIIEHVTHANSNASTITTDTIPDRIKKLFKKGEKKPPHLDEMPQSHEAEPQPQDKIPQKTELQPPKTPTYSFIHDETNFVRAVLIGAWNEHCDDVKILKQLYKADYDSWVKQAQQILNAQEHEIISLFNGSWKIQQSKELFARYSDYIFDADLKQFQTIAIEVLTETDPQLEAQEQQNSDSWFFARDMKHSSMLRTGIANGLAILAHSPKPKNCSSNVHKRVALSCVKTIFANIDVALFYSLNDVLPILAEISPEIFLHYIESDLEKSDSLLMKVYAQKKHSHWGLDTAGLMRGLESLAWDAKFLCRICVILAQLTTSNFDNRLHPSPYSSLQTILLPWFPQTTEGRERRQAAVDILCKKYPSVAWQLLLDLLPNRVTTSMGTNKPKWRLDISDHPTAITRREYWNQVEHYTQKLFSLVHNDADRLCAIIENIGDIIATAFNTLLELLSNISIKDSDEHDRSKIWHTLIKIVEKHKAFPDAKWSLDATRIASLEKVAQQLEPHDITILYKPLFSHNNFRFHGQEEEKIEHQNSAVKNILTEKGIDAVIRFANTVDEPRTVGNFLASTEMVDIDTELLPRCVSNKTDSKLLEFVYGYIQKKIKLHGWKWIDSLEKKEWNTSQLNLLLCCLPFDTHTWQRVDKWLGNHNKLYWQTVIPHHPYNVNELNHAIRQFLRYKRPLESIRCFQYIYAERGKINHELAAQTLLALIELGAAEYADSYVVTRSIDTLQQEERVNTEDIANIEWDYLLLMDSSDGFKPLALENKIVSDPSYFCNIIQLCYKSTHQKEQVSLTKTQQKNVEIGTRLLEVWSRIPGVDSSNDFHPQQFVDWVATVRQLCHTSGHLDSALYVIGTKLINSPVDPDGLWIHKTIAEILEDPNAVMMRNGLYDGFFNARGTNYDVDGSGKQEIELAKHYSELAKSVEDAVYMRLASTMRSLSHSYQNEAEQVQNIYKSWQSLSDR